MPFSNPPSPAEDADCIHAGITCREYSMRNICPCDCDECDNPEADEV